MKRITLLLFTLIAATIGLRATLHADPPVIGARDFPIRNDIDKYVLMHLEQAKITPSPVCSDEEFMRRAYLDIGGAIPSLSDAREFLNDKAPDKRAKLIDTLLAG